MNNPFDWDKGTPQPLPGQLLADNWAVLRQILPATARLKLPEEGLQEAGGRHGHQGIHTIVDRIKCLHGSFQAERWCRPMSQEEYLLHKHVVFLRAQAAGVDAERVLDKQGGLIGCQAVLMVAQSVIEPVLTRHGIFFAWLLCGRVFIRLSLRSLHTGPGLHRWHGGFVALDLLFGEQKSNQSRQHGNNQE